VSAPPSELFLRPTVIAEESGEQFVRDALFGAATFLTWKGLIERERMQRFLVRFFEERLASAENESWTGWLEAIALLGLRELVPLVDSAWDQGLIPEFSYSRKEFDADLLAAEERPDDLERFKERQLGYIEDIIEALEWSDVIEDDELSDDVDPFRGEPLDFPRLDAN
jgi:hypothetical protein